MTLKGRLKSIGMKTFRECYEIAAQKGERLTVEDLVRYDPTLQGTSPKALKTRLSNIKCIFREGVQEEALRMAKNAKDYYGN